MKFPHKKYRTTKFCLPIEIFRSTEFFICADFNEELEVDAFRHLLVEPANDFQK